MNDEWLIVNGIRYTPKVKNKPNPLCFIVLLLFCNKFLLQKGKKGKGQRAFTVFRQKPKVKTSLNPFALLFFCPFAINSYYKKAKKRKGKGYLIETRNRFMCNPLFSFLSSLFFPHPPKTSVSRPRRARMKTP